MRLEKKRRRWQRAESCGGAAIDGDDSAGLGPFGVQLVMYARRGANRICVCQILNRTRGQTAPDRDPIETFYCVGLARWWKAATVAPAFCHGIKFHGRLWPKAVITRINQDGSKGPNIVTTKETKLITNFWTYVVVRYYYYSPKHIPKMFFKLIYLCLWCFGTFTGYG
jgi:hypothetical protein